MALMRANALLTERLPGNVPLTRDLLKMLEHGDNVVSNDDAVAHLRGCRSCRSTNSCARAV